MVHKTKIYGLGLIFLLTLTLFSACLPQLGRETETPTITSSATPLPPTSTPLSPTPTATPLPTSTPTITPSSTITIQPEELTFAVIGDYGLAGSGEWRVAKLVKSWNPQIIITTGDNNYPRGSSKTIDENIGQYFHEFIHPYKGVFGEGADTNRFFPSLGNHDWRWPEPGPYLNYFTLPGNERYYDFAWGPVHFFALNSVVEEPDGVVPKSKQGQWLKENLHNSVLPWKIVYFHHAPYSSGPHGPTEWMQWPFKKWGASAVIAGHDHTYERLHIDGLTYFVNGLGGNGRYEFEDILPQSEKRYREDYGAIRVKASREKITFTFISTDGDVIDTYSLNK